MSNPVHSRSKVLYVSKNDGTDTRMSKQCNSLAFANYDIAMLGWDRAPQRQKSNPIRGVRQIILRYKASYRSKMLLFSMWKYIFFLIRNIHREKPEIVHAVNEDLAVLVLILKPVYKYRVVCDIYDSFSLRYASSNWILRNIVNMLCKFAWRFSDAILVTDEARRARLKLRDTKSWIVPNYPVDVEGLEPALLPKKNGSTYVYVTGTLYAARGLRQMQSALDQTEGVYVISAGWIRDHIAEKFIEHPKVEYVGVITPAESLAYAASCDAVLAMYEPTDENMLLASPNKIYDAMCVGRPTIINSETNIAKWVSESKVGYTCSYWDERALIEILNSLSGHGPIELHRPNEIRALFERGYSWKTSEYALLRCYEMLGCAEYRNGVEPR